MAQPQSDGTALFELEKKFWQSMVDEDTDTALELLTEPSYMVSSHGAMKFDHAAFKKMSEQGTMIVRSFELSDMEATFPAEHTGVVTYKVKQKVVTRGQSDEKIQFMNDTSTWLRVGDRWQCVMHTETPIQA